MWQEKINHSVKVGIATHDMSWKARKLFKTATQKFNNKILILLVGVTWLDNHIIDSIITVTDIKRFHAFEV